MHTETIDTVIVGGGLSGIFAADLLSRENKPFVILEARERIGGRILSPEHEGYFADLGPSWYWPAIHPMITRLIAEMGLTGYRQFETGRGRFQRADGRAHTVAGFTNEPPSWRLDGGMMALVNALHDRIPANSVRCDHPVCQIEKTSAGVLLSVGELEGKPRAQFKARRVILALPPRLAAATILFTPELSHELTQAMLKTGTWMAGQAKFCALYNEPFWRQSGLSGQAFSECGPLGEIHDGSANDSGPYGFTGFVGLPAVQRSQHPQLTEAIESQLGSLFGEPAVRPVAFFYQDWACERYTATAYDQPPMLNHPLYRPPAGHIAIWRGAILFAGTETASQHGGYLEGALAAAERAVSNL